MNAEPVQRFMQLQMTSRHFNALSVSLCAYSTVRLAMRLDLSAFVCTPDGVPARLFLPGLRDFFAFSGRKVPDLELVLTSVWHELEISSLRSLWCGVSLGSGARARFNVAWA